jgi:radical SAM superfamily enzyme YgiQ (UPF0313 family)
MAKVLLINSNRFKHPWPVIPFGLCYVATVLEFNENHKVFFLDLSFSSDCGMDIQKTIQSFNPDVIGVSIRNIDDTGGYVVHFLLEDVKNDVIDYCKKEFVGPIVIGGPSVGISGREMLDYFDLEYAVLGDGENAMSEFVYRIENHLALEGMKGLIIRREGMIIQDNEPNLVTDLDTLPFPKLNHYLNLDLYRRYGSPILVQTKRGCTFDCAYCTYNQIEGKKYRLRDPQQIADEIEVLVKESGINHIEFADSIFNVPLSHAKQVLRSVIGKRLSLKLHTMGLTPAAVDEELLDLMKLAGFNEVDIGVESTSDIVLKSLAKDFKLRDIIKTAILLREKRIPATWFIILGSPAETSETVFETLNSMRKITSKWDLVFVSTGVRVYNGSPYANEMFRKDNQCSSDNFFRPVKIEPEKISLEEIRAITKSFLYRYPNYYFYDKEHITPGWLLITANFLLKIFHSRQPVWRLLILLKMMEKGFGISLVRKRLYELNKSRNEKYYQKKDGFSLISILHK